MAYLARLFGFSSPQTNDQALPMDPLPPKQPLKQPLKQRLDRRSMSPNTRTKHWIIHTPDLSSESETPTVLRVKGSKVVKHKQITPSFTRISGASAKGRGASYWGPSWLTGKSQNVYHEEDTLIEDNELVEEGTSNEDEELIEEEEMVEEEDLIEDETLIEDDAPAAYTPTPNYVNNAGNDDTLIPDEWEANKEDDEDDYVGKLSKGERKEHLLDVEDERARRQEMLKQIERGDRTPEEIALFEKLTMRGFEPIIPSNWKMDFKTLPETMFTNDESEIFINAASGNEFRGISSFPSCASPVIPADIEFRLATKALNALISLGVRARDRLVRSLSPEDTLRRGIESYIKWAERDGDISRNDESHIPVLTVGTAKPGESVASIVGRVTDQLHSFGSRYREKWLLRQSIEGSEAENEAGDGGDPEQKLTTKDQVPIADAIGEEFSHDLPTLYGIVIKHTVVAMVTYDVCVPGQEVRSIAMFDFGKPDQDVWNGLAVAILVIICRNYLMDLAAEEEAEMQSAEEDEEEEEKDVDA